MNIRTAIKSMEDAKKAVLLQRFFKTGKGEYGEGDVFLGLTVPQSRQIAKNYWKSASLGECQALLNSKYHEERFISLLILIHKYKKSDKEGDEQEKKRIYEFYMSNTKRVNNWDLVDVTCRDIIGAYLFDKDKKPLYDFAKSSNLWEKRISLISTFYFINKNQLQDSIKLCEILLYDSHDLIHKAVGWTLREVGKKDSSLLENFLKKHCKTMPRTALRYAIEKFPETKRKAYLNGRV